MLEKAIVNPKQPIEKEWFPDMNNIWHRFMSTQEPRLRLSFGALCARQRWFENNMPDAAEPVGKERLMFSMGDLFETLSLPLLKAEIESLPNTNWRLDLNDGDHKTVYLRGYAGHTDAQLYWRDNPYAIIDTKYTSKWVHKNWEDGRKPDPKWGYRHQAANYIGAYREEGENFKGFIWLCGLREFNDFGNGWMTAEELKPYEEEALAMFKQAESSKMPAPCAGFPNATPCAGKTKTYCKFYKACAQEEGIHV